MSLITGGIYPTLWIQKHCSSIERITKAKIADETFIIWLAVCLGLNYTLAYWGTELGLEPGLALRRIEDLAGLAWLGLLIYWSFKARNALQEYALTELRIDLKMNVLYTVLFDIFYINYCINDLPEEYRRQQVLNSRMDKDEGPDGEDDDTR